MRLNFKPRAPLIRVNLRRVTQADFPRQNWGEWLKEHVEAPDGDGRTIDTKYMSPRPCCIHCATWICAECWDWRRVGATRGVSQYCARCGGRAGFFMATRHLRDHEAPPMVPFRVPNINERKTMHVPEEADMAKSMTEGLSEEEARARGLLPPRLTEDDLDEATYGSGDELEEKERAEEQAEVQELRDAANKILPDVVTRVLEKIREAYANGNGPENILAFTIRDLQELCDLAVQYPKQDGDYIVLGPEVFATKDGNAVCWQGENYYKMGQINAQRVPTDKDRELIAKNAKATIERRDKERAERLQREMAMHHAVAIHTAGLGAGHIPTKSLSDTAEDILTWLTKTSGAQDAEEWAKRG